MNAAVVQAFDAPPRYASFADPVAQEGEVLVTLTAAGLHPIVKVLANGTHYASTGELPFRGESLTFEGQKPGLPRPMAHDLGKWIEDQR